MSIETRGRLRVMGGGGEFAGGDGLERHAVRGREGGASSIQSERDVVDIVVVQMIGGDGRVRMASG